MSKEKLVSVNDVQLCVEGFGSPDAPAILLIAGAASSMDWWEDEFCARLAEGPRFVLRYDMRDTGRSTSYKAGAPQYTVRDLADDAVGLLDAFGQNEAHLVGISMGGGIAQLIALEYADRVTSLTLLSTTPGGPGGSANSDLPPMSAELAAVFANPAPPPDWSNRAAVIEYVVEGTRPFAGLLPFDESTVRGVAKRAFDRTEDMEASQSNHWIIATGEPPSRARLGAIVAPTLVMHGTADPLFPYAHAIALAAEIPSAQLLALDGVGHEMPPRDMWDAVIPAILKHTSGC